MIPKSDKKTVICGQTVAFYIQFIVKPCETLSILHIYREINQIIYVDAMTLCSDLNCVTNTSIHYTELLSFKRK